MYTFAQPWWLVLLLLPALEWYWIRRRRKVVLEDPVLRLPTAAALSGPRAGGWRARWRTALPLLRGFALGFLILALARPQRQWKEEKIKADAVDIMLAMDISPSMLSKDFTPDRLAVSKRLAIDFVEKRPYDRLGLVAFSAQAFTQCPLTTDREIVSNYIRDLKIGVLSDGTAIGMGLATACSRLKDSPAKSKVVILLTDGDNNAGDIPPEQAAELAKELNIRVHTIAIGSGGTVLSPVTRDPMSGAYSFDFRPSDFDTDLLQQISATTDGRFFLARTPEDLAGIYDIIDKLEKTKVEITAIRRVSDYFPWLLGAAFVLLVLEVLLRWGVLRGVTA